MAPSTNNGYVVPNISQAAKNQENDIFNLSWNDVEKDKATPSKTLPSNNDSTSNVQTVNNLLDMDIPMTSNTSSNNIPETTNNTNEDNNDIWEFQTVPVQNPSAEYEQNGLKIKMEQTKVENSIHVIEVSLSNKKEYNMEDLVFQVK